MTLLELVDMPGSEYTPMILQCQHPRMPTRDVKYVDGVKQMYTNKVVTVFFNHFYVTIIVMPLSLLHV